MPDIAENSSADVADVALAAARPAYPGEAEINLQAATLTSSGCTSPALAIDDDPATAAVFGAPAQAFPPAIGVLSDNFHRPNTAAGAAGTTTGAGNNLTDVSGGIWRIQNNLLLATCDGNNPAGLQISYDFLTGTALGNTRDLSIVFTLPAHAFGASPTPGVSAVSIFRYQGASQYCYFAAFEYAAGASQITQFVLEKLGAGGQTILGAVNFPGYDPARAYQVAATISGSSPATLWGSVTDLTTNQVVTSIGPVTDGEPSLQAGGLYGLDVSSTSAGPQVSFSALSVSNQPPPMPTPRLLRVDWGFDAFVSRIRLAYNGPGAGNAGVDYESSLSYAEGHSPPADIALSYLPTPVDGQIHEIVFSPPVIGRGAVFYPDALAAGPASQPVNLYQLQVYQDISQNSQGVPSMANPTIKQARVGCSGLVITPRAYTMPTSYPFPQVLATALQSIQSLNFSSASKLARETGGESVHQLNGYETDREVKCKFSVERHDYLALQNLIAGTLVVNPANVNGPETQYHAPNYADRAPYFSLVALSTNGDPAAQFVLPKCKIDGNLTQDFDRDKVTMIDVDFVLFWDALYTRQDGQLGALYEQVFNNGGATALHS